MLGRGYAERGDSRASKKYICTARANDRGDTVGDFIFWISLSTTVDILFDGKFLA